MKVEHEGSATARESTVILVRLGKKRGRRKKKSLPGLGGIDKLTGRVVEGQLAFFETYRKGHGKANASRRSGWMRELPRNLWRATRAGMKKSIPRIGDLFLY